MPKIMLPDEEPESRGQRRVYKVTSLYGKLKPLNTNNGSAWKFEAYLGAADDRPATLRAIVKSVMGDDAGKAVPDFANTDIPAAPAGTSPMTLIVNKTEVKYPQIDEVRIGFTVNIVLSPAEFTFAQIASTKDGTITVKRVLRISISNIPFLSNLPVVKELPQPFQKLVYLWVVKRDGDESALMEDEVKAINKELGDQSNQVDFKSSTNLLAPQREFKQRTLMNTPRLISPSPSVIISSSSKITRSFSITFSTTRRALHLRHPAECRGDRLPTQL
jgi:hypothetical protein